MRVVQQGKAPKKYPWIGRWLCAYCDSVIDLHESDAGSVTGYKDDQRDGASVNILCPVCDKKRLVMEFEKTTTYVDDRKHWDAVPFGDQP